jgi:hypothetical protein
MEKQTITIQLQARARLLPSQAPAFQEDLQSIISNLSPEQARTLRKVLESPVMKAEALKAAKEFVG